MWEACYCLDVNDLKDIHEKQFLTSEDTSESMAANRQVMIQKMEALLDQERLLKYQDAKDGKAKILRLGAGALLRLAWAESQATAAGSFEAREKQVLSGEAPIPMTPGEVILRLEALPKFSEPRYCYGEKGKPYFKDSALSFSLSHSGDLVLCAIADHEIGVDVQKVIDLEWEKLAKRFFSLEEQDWLSSVDSKEEFFRLWCRKEAFGKMTGEGAATYLGQSFLKEQRGIALRDGKLSIRGETYYYCVCTQEAERLF